MFLFLILNNYIQTYIRIYCNKSVPHEWFCKENTTKLKAQKNKTKPMKITFMPHRTWKQTKKKN